jgi:hypothetical protein
MGELSLETTLSFVTVCRLSSLEVIPFVGACLSSSEVTPFGRVSQWLSLQAAPFGVPLERTWSEATTGEAQTARIILSMAEGDGRFSSDQRPGISECGSMVTFAEK